MKEIWKPVKGFRLFYEVSSRGRVRSLDCIRICQKRKMRFKGRTLRLNSKKYGSVLRLRGDFPDELVIQVHRLVAMHFVPNPKRLPFVCHKNDDPTNNRASNLVWATHQENLQQAVTNGRFKINGGQSNGNAKLTSKTVILIRKAYKRYDRGAAGAEALAKRFKVHPAHLRKILRGNYWGHNA